MPQTGKKKTHSRPQQEREPQLGQQEAQLERKGDSELHHMEGIKSNKPRTGENE
jgi:hypothetical protein